MSKNTVSSYIKAASIALWLSLPISEAQAEVKGGFQQILDYEQSVLDSWSNICFPKQDFSEYFMGFHTVSGGDTLSQIASQYWFEYTHLLKILRNHPFDTIDFVLWDLDLGNPHKLRIWDKIPILAPSYIDDYNKFEYQYRIFDQYDSILTAWELWYYDYLNKYFSYEITPSRPISTWIMKPLEVLWNMWVKDIKAHGPANVDSRFIWEAVCAHQDRRWDKISVNPNDSHISLRFRELVMQYNLDAWMFSDKYVETWLYTIPEKYDWRTLFSKHFSKGINPIASSHRKDYNDWLWELLWYLAQEWIPGTKIPTKFLYTNAQAIIQSYRGGINQASHVITYLWEYTSDPFIAGEYTPTRPIKWFNFWEKGIELWDFLAYLVQDQTDMYFILNSVYHSQIKQRILPLSQHIKLWINGEEINVSEVLARWDLFIHSQDKIQIWWSLTKDGFHLYTSPNPQESSEMTTRLRPLWVHLASGVMFPANIIEPWEEVQSMWFWWKHGDILSKIVVRDYISLRPWENARDVILEYLAQEKYSTSYNYLDEAQQRVIKSEYRLQSIGHQLYWNQNFSWSEWRKQTEGTPYYFPEEAVTFAYGPIEIFQTDNIEDIYRQYMTARKIDYYRMLRQEQCIDMVRPFLRVKFFPGDTLSVIPHQLAAQLDEPEPWLAKTVRSLDPIKKIHFINSLFWERISSGDINAGQEMKIWIDELMMILRDLNKGLFQSNFELLDKNWEVSFHSRVLEKMVDNPDWLQLMKYILANESYVNNSENIDDLLYQIFKIETLSRRGAKNILYSLKELGITKVFNTSILPSIWTNFRIPTTNSQWDYQMRFPNLYSHQYLYKWPANDLRVILSEILKEDGVYVEEIQEKNAEFPDIVRKDLSIAREILDILQNDPEQSRWSEVAERLASLMRYDPWNVSNVVGFIISSYLARELLHENIENFVHLLTISWVRIASLDEEKQSRVMASTARCFNMGAKTCQLAFWDVYINRFLEWLNKKYEINYAFPGVKRTWGIRNAKIYSRFVFTNTHVPAYLDFIQKINSEHTLTNKESLALESLETSLIQIKQEPANYQAGILEIFSNQELKQWLIELWLDDFILPTHDENAGKTSDLTKSLLADYANSDIIENRVQKPYLSKEKKNSIYILLTLWFLYSFTSIIVQSIYLPVKFSWKKILKSLDVLLKILMRRKK